MGNKILAFSGSIRTGSINSQALEHAIAGAREAGAEVTHIDLRDYPLPLMNEDLEASHGVPSAAVQLKTLFKAHDGLLLACPEYNSSITPLLKNTLDWVSRTHAGESGLVPYQGKWAALVSASTGNLGGIRGLRHVREILTTLQVLVIPQQMAVSQADKALADPGSHGIKGLRATGSQLANYLLR